MEPRLICLTAAGLSVLPSFVSGVLASREGLLLNWADCDGAGEYGDVSRRVMGRGWRKGRERERPKATSTGRVKGDRARDPVREMGTALAIEGEGRERDAIGRTADRRSMAETWTLRPGFEILEFGCPETEAKLGQ
jgi:hypothetical protein